MLKAYIVTKYASLGNLTKIEERTILTFKEGLEKVLTVGRDPDFLVSADAPPEFMQTIHVGAEEADDFLMQFEIGIQALNKKGFKEIDILLEECDDHEFLLALVILFRRYPKMRLIARFRNSTLTLYQEGSYLINRNDLPYIRIYPLSEKLKLSFDHVETKTMHLLLVREKGPMYHRNFIPGRVAVLHVEKGEAVLIQAKGATYA